MNDRLLLEDGSGILLHENGDGMLLEDGIPFQPFIGAPGLFANVLQRAGCDERAAVNNRQSISDLFGDIERVRR